MAQLLFIALPVAVSLYCYLLGRHRELVIWAGSVTLILEGYLLTNLPLEQPTRLLGILFSLTALDRLFGYVFIFLAAVIIIGAYALHQGELPTPITLLILGVINVILLLNDPIVISLLLEVIGLAIVLVTVDRPHEPLGLLPVAALMAGLKYLVTMVLSGIALVMGFLLLNLYAQTTQPEAMSKMGMGLIVIGLGLGMAVAPLHLWLPDLAAHTSTAVTGLLVALSQGAGLLLLGRVLLDQPMLLQGNPRGQVWLLGGAILASVVAALLALSQDRLKRLAAYAASYDVALILYALGLASATGLQAGLLMTIHRGLALLLLLLCIGVLEWSTGRDDVAGLVGVGQHMPVVTVGLVAAGLSLVGIPPLGGFLAHWMIYGQALEQSWLYLAGMLVAGALFLLAMVRAFWPIFLPTGQTVPFRQPPWQVQLLILVLVVALLLFGLFPKPLLGVLEQASRGLVVP